MTETTSQEAILRELHASLGLRRRPEDIAHLILDLLDHAPAASPVPGSLRRTLARAARGSLRNLWHGYTSLYEESTRPPGARRAAAPFPTLPDLPGADADDPRRIEAAIRTAGQEMAERSGPHTPRTGRAAAGIGDVSRRQDDRRHRLLRRMETRLARLLAERRKRETALTGRGGLASRLPYARFAADPATAAFVAYRTARANLRSEFTVSGQQRPYDEVAEALHRWLRDRPRTTDWFAVAHAHPTAEVLGRLTDRQRGELLGLAYGVLRDVAGLLEAAWERQPPDRATMIVRQDDDATGWNAAARAWTAARATWFALLHAVGAQEVTERLCPGKVPLLVAADVAAWHRRVGGALHPDTRVFAELPLPWRVLRGEEPCPRSLVEQMCRRHGVDPVTSGWTEPTRAPRPARFRPTPGLVAGVEASDPFLARVLPEADAWPGRERRVRERLFDRPGRARSA